jgi:hypothetical protein
MVGISIRAQITQMPFSKKVAKPNSADKKKPPRESYGTGLYSLFGTV